MTDELSGTTVAFVVPHTPESVGYDSIEEFLSFAQYHRRFCELLADRGAEVEFLFMTRRPAPESPAVGFRILPCRVVVGESFGRELSWSMLSRLARTDADIVHIHGYNQPNVLPVLLATGVSSARVVVQNHGGALDPDETVYRLWYRLLGRALPRLTDDVVSVNRDEMENLQRYGVPAVHLPNAVDADRFRPMDRDRCRRRLDLDPDRQYVLYVGRLTENKGVTYLLEAIARLPEELDPELLLVYSGESEAERERIDRVIERESLGAHIRFVGSVDHETLPVYYNAANLCAFPSINEGFGIVALEAMACGTPVVGTTEHAAGGHLRHGENGLVAEPGSVDDLATHLAELLSNPEFAAELGECGRETVLDRYTWERVGNVLTERYRVLLSDE